MRKLESPADRFGKNLKALRMSLGMTAAELAKRAGMTPAAISQIEAGKREPILSTVVRIMDVIPVKFERLIE